jgi:hypothetical protein
MSQSEGIYDLGKKLVLELGLENEVDTLARWMAHHISELIKNVEAATGDERAAKSKECRDAIIDLWKTRHELPNGKRPFENFEEVFRALERLDPENKTPRYFMSGRPKAADADDPLTQYLELVEGIDYTARVLIEYALGEAAALSKGKVRDWILAAQADVEEGQDIAIVRKLISMSDDLNDTDPDEERREMLQDRLKRLQSFQAFADIAIDVLQKRLAKTKPKPARNTPKRKLTKKSGETAKTTKRKRSLIKR